MESWGPSTRRPSSEGNLVHWSAIDRLGTIELIHCDQSVQWHLGEDRCLQVQVLVVLQRAGQQLDCEDAASLRHCKPEVLVLLSDPRAYLWSGRKEGCGVSRPYDVEFAVSFAVNLPASMTTMSLLCLSSLIAPTDRGTRSLDGVRRK